MRVMVFGADGFIGRNVKEELSTNHIVGSATRSGGAGDDEFAVDLLDVNTIKNALSEFHPDALVNCAGVVGGNDDVTLNQIFTENILKTIVDMGLVLDIIIISGSAAEYGDVESLPVPETAPLSPTTAYGVAKVNETRLALEYKVKHKLPITIARIFNPIGADMHEKFLIPQLIKQVAEVIKGSREFIEISRLDSQRDYVSIKDVAIAMRTILEAKPETPVYNVGSGVSTSNEELVAIIIKHSKMTKVPDVHESSTIPEKQVASRADIRLIQTELGWEPKQTLEETVKEVIYATRR